MIHDGICSEDLSRRFADTSLDQLRGVADVSLRDMEIYGQIISALTENSEMLTDTADYCRSFDNHLAFRRIGIERATLAALMMARVERLGFKLIVRTGAFGRGGCLVHSLAKRLSGNDRVLIWWLSRVEDRLGARIRRALADPRLGSAVSELIESALRTAAPGRDLQQVAAARSEPA